ncbi:hypothetical protein [Nostoc sp. NMS8]|nr:hypothetical protein [Nostoc sp. NMS8]
MTKNLLLITSGDRTDHLAVNTYPSPEINYGLPEIIRKHNS